MGFLPLQGGMRHEAGKIAVLHAQLLNLRVKEVLDRLPDSKGPGPQDVAAGHIVVLHHLSLSQNLRQKCGLSLRFVIHKSKCRMGNFSHN